MKTKKSYTNKTSRYQIVGNCATVISTHATVEQVNKTLSMLPSVDDSEWSTIYVVAPGETVTCELTPPPVRWKSVELPWKFTS